MMLKKNRQKNSHSPLTRIIINTKLPCDFFQPQKIKKCKQPFLLQLGQHLKQQHYFTGPKNSMLFTFNRSHSPAHSQITSRPIKKSLAQQSSPNIKLKEAQKFPAIPNFVQKDSNNQAQSCYKKMHKISTRAFPNRKLIRQVRAELKDALLLNRL